MIHQTYFDRARRRARRRKSRWNLVLLFLSVTMFAGVWRLLFTAVVYLQRFVAPGNVFGETMSDPGEALMTLPLMFPALVIGMMAANSVLRRIGPARRTFDREAAGFPEFDYDANMRIMSIISAVLLMIALPLSVLGAVDPF